MAGGPYNIPRNTKGEGRFFYIFSTKALIVTAVLAGMGYGIGWAIGKLINYTVAEKAVNADEQAKLDNSCKIIKEMREQSIDKIINE